MRNFIFILLCLLLTASCEPATDNISHATPAKSEAQIQQVAPTLTPGRYNVAFLIMEGVYNTELTAPWDIFHHTQFRKGIQAMNVFSVAKTSESITSFEGLRIVPDFNYLTDSLPPIHILVIPAANHHTDTDLDDKAMLDFVRKISSTAEYVMSHCDGAFVLAKSGVLDGFKSTTFPGDVAKYKEMFPHLEVYEDVVFVRDGKFITSQGGAKSFDASLYLCEFLYGKEVANELAKGMVIDWNIEIVPMLVTRREK